MGFWQIEPQRASYPEPTRSLESGHVTCQAKLVGNPASDLVRMNIGSQLRLCLRLGKPDRFGRLQRRSRCLQLLQPRNPINAHRIRHLGPVPHAFALSNTVSETS